jgi:hypothetical protein
METLCVELRRSASAPQVAQTSVCVLFSALTQIKTSQAEACATGLPQNSREQCALGGSPHPPASTPRFSLAPASPLDAAPSHLPNSSHQASFRGRSVGDISIEWERGHYHRGSTGSRRWCSCQLVRDKGAGESTSDNWLGDQLNLPVC